MCLAVPLKLIEICPDRKSGAVDAGGSVMSVGLALVPEAHVGDYVLVHAGMAIEIVNESEANATLELFTQYAQTTGLLEPRSDKPNE